MRSLATTCVLALSCTTAVPPPVTPASGTPSPVTAVPGAPSTATATATAPPFVDVTRLPIGDGRRAASPQRGAVFACPDRRFGGGPQPRPGPWIGQGTYDLSAKATVDGDVRWPSRIEVEVTGALRSISGNGLPAHGTGIFPVAAADDAYAYDPNPGRIAAQSVRLQVSARPEPAAAPGCVGGGPIGVALTGALVFDAFDAAGLDAVAREVQDTCGGHPAPNGTYHYHGVPTCVSDTAAGHSEIFGYVLDGFGIFGPRGEAGTLLGAADLDECHGHTHEIDWDGARATMYHYHFTYDFPYSVGCYRGTPAPPPR